MKAKLTAIYQKRKAIKYFEGENSVELTCQAIEYILNKAIFSQLWSKGKIILQDNKGNILKEMKEKK